MKIAKRIVAAAVGYPLYVVTGLVVVAVLLPAYLGVITAECLIGYARTGVVKPCYEGM